MKVDELISIPLSLNREQEHANEQLTSMLTNSAQVTKGNSIKGPKEETNVTGSKYEHSCPSFKSLGAKPKDKSLPRELGGQLITGTQSQEISEPTGWLLYQPGHDVHQLLQLEKLRCGQLYRAE